MDTPPAVPQAPVAGPVPTPPTPPTPPTRPPRQRLATASLALGVLGNLGLGPFAGVPAVIAGHVAFGRSRRHPDTHGGRGVAIAGFVLGYVSFLLGLPVLAILLTVLVPGIQKARYTAADVRCRENLVRVAAVVREYADTHDHRFPARAADLVTPAIPADTFDCPGDPTLRPRRRPGGAAPDRYRAAYELMTPGVAAAETTGKPILRCPIHGHTVQPDGSIQPGKPGIRRPRKAAD